MKTFVRIFVDLCIVILLVLFAFFLLYLHTGSWEMVPTEEDQGKALVVSAFGMIVTGVPCAVCIGLRATVLRKK
ncbi:MAG: hypothetical protein HFF17_13335 [Oscillospiraceae bacterium]|nr:hypothetical protein [Oscillospiraceae bacterium]